MEVMQSVTVILLVLKYLGMKYQCLMSRSPTGMKSYEEVAVTVRSCSHLLLLYHIPSVTSNMQFL